MHARLYMRVAPCPCFSFLIMCKHILNAQVAVRAPCCRKWFDCPECHAETADHPLQKTVELVFACKKCKKVFRKDSRSATERDVLKMRSGRGEEIEEGRGR